MAGDQHMKGRDGIKYIQILNKCFCVCQCSCGRVRACECVSPQLEVFNECWSMSHLCLLISKANISSAQRKLSAFGTHTDPNRQTAQTKPCMQIRQRQTGFCSHPTLTDKYPISVRYTTAKMHVFVGVKVGGVGWRCICSGGHANSAYCPLWVKWFLTTPKWSPEGEEACSHITELLYDRLCVWES